MKDSKRYWAERRVALVREALAADPTMTDADVATYVDDAIADEEYDAHVGHEEDERTGRIPDDSPCIENGVDNCDDSGSGEGRYHGRM